MSTAVQQDLLEINQLRVRYRSLGPLKALLKGNKDPYLDAVADVSMTLVEGETYGIVGESGAGKTTLGRTIVGLASATNGSIKLNKTELTNLPAKKYKSHRREIGMMFQDPVASLSPRLTVRALLSEPFQIHQVNVNQIDQNIERLLNMVGLLPDFLDRYPHELSGGQARRVGVARALALEPRLIIADEPTAGLDVSVQGEILNLMADLQDQLNMSYLIISHNLPVVRHVSDKIAIMYLGRFVEQGNAEAIFNRPGHPYTKALLEGVPQPDPDKRREIVSIEGEVPSLADRPTGCEFHTRCNYAQSHCKQEQPTLQKLGANQYVRCHFPLNR
ncbi:MAG: ABC transporter ATP-binding protein [Dehalococcoidia bacterium]|jgi:oligopeptide/dipeptide ABC transporter ATP-binding protein|nr:ABC transporter ATP-binding protein [Dehalococcoidia bacterium]|tara:strand:+ start:4848 stop:5843 length:996 start_codon:yes stop_codon:yes gene_type:complete